MSDKKIIYRTYKYRLNPTKKQGAVFNDWLETCRRLYNYFVQQRFEHWEYEKQLPKEYRIYITQFDQNKQLPILKKDNQYLKNVNAGILQNVSKRVAKTFSDFIREISNRNSKYGKPKFKRRKEYNSFTYPFTRNETRKIQV